MAPSLCIKLVLLTLLIPLVLSGPSGVKEHGHGQGQCHRSMAS
uniref:Uncharacterized protein n=1 Tax=Anguilla anguilla TaxID=7936 RepID=A0A0E9RAJ8_ANGAN